MQDMMPSRRKFLKTSLILGCSAAASPFFTPVTFAAAPGDNRFVAIILRGGMDGLDAVQPYGDRALSSHRKTIKAGEAAGAHDLDGFFALNQNLGDLMPLWQAGELNVAHAVSTPYRNKRSHFDGQDLLENGGNSSDGGLTPGRDGWLNRLLGLMSDTTIETAMAIGRESPLILSGTEPAANWSPDSDLDISPQAELLLNAIYAQDPLFHEASGLALRLSEDGDVAKGMGPGKAGRASELARLAAERLNADSRIATFSINGWDTHASQNNAIKRAMQQLSEAILTLKDGLGPNWERTTVVCMTEFGRTVRENGNRGTDHGTGGAMLMAGGALRGAKVHADWPGLADSDLYQNRDLMPTQDIRRFAAWALHGMFGVDREDLVRGVFPGLDMGSDPKLLA